MRTLKIIFLKELAHYCKSPFGWIVFAFVLLMQGLCFTTALKSYQDAPTPVNLFRMEFSNPLFSFFYVFIFPLITMKLFAEEERIGTREPLMTAPVHTWQVLLGKYFAAFSYYIFLWLPLLLHIIFFEWVSDNPAPIEHPEVLSTYIFLLSTGAFFTAIGCLASSLTSSQIIAGIITTASITFFIFLGSLTYRWGNSFQAASFFQFISFDIHMSKFIQGLVDTRTVVLYISLAFFTLTVTLHVIDFRRWKN